MPRGKRPLTWRHDCGPASCSALTAAAGLSHDSHPVTRNPQQQLPENPKTFDAIFLSGLHDTTPSET